jgi:tetratricopeptide (TPR) repeat protein
MYLGEVYLDSGRLKEAGEAFSRALKLDPQNEKVKRMLIENLISADQHQVAEKVIQSLMKQNPSDRYLLNRMGIALRKQGKLKEALINYQKAVQMDDRDEHLYFNLGRCYFELGAMEEAQAITSKALKINPELREARELLAKIKQQ